jgi:hypothetical protein
MLIIRASSFNRLIEIANNRKWKYNSNFPRWVKTREFTRGVIQIVCGINIAVAQSDQFLILPVRKKSFFEALYR